LIDSLPLALQGADPLPQIDLERTRRVAKLALKFLFDEPNLFNVPTNIAIKDLSGVPAPVTANDPAASFDASLVYEHPQNFGVNQNLPEASSKSIFMEYWSQTGSDEDREMLKRLFSGSIVKDRLHFPSRADLQK
jgi:hypothetical protein